MQITPALRPLQQHDIDSGGGFSTTRPADALVTDAELRRNPTVKAEAAGADQGHRPAVQRPVFELPQALLSPVPLLLGTNGEKMSKSRGNAVALGADEDTTARLIRATRTDSLRCITYQPKIRPRVGSLLQIIGFFTGSDPTDAASRIGNGGAGALKRMAIEVVNDSLRPLRARRHQLLADPGHLDGVLLHGIAQANDMANETLHRVRSAMGMDYLAG